MSPVFALQEREEISKKLLNAGITLISEKGMRKMTIDEVTLMAGIGKGTFYHFYESKEIFIYDVIQFSKNKMYETLNQIIEQEGGINRSAFLSLFHRFSFSSNANILSCITADDVLWLNSKLPAAYVLNPPKEEAIADLLLKHMIHTRPRTDINTHVLANMFKIMAIAVENRHLLHQDVLQENIQIMEQELCNYIFES